MRLLRRRPRVDLIGFIEPGRGPWMEMLEARVLLSGADADRVRPGYFRYWGAGAISADPATNNRSNSYIVDVTDPAFDGTLATFWGDMPHIDRAYVKLGEKWEPAALVDGPGPTFQFRVGDDVPVHELDGPTSIALIDDRGGDYIIGGPRLVNQPGTLVALDGTYWSPSRWTRSSLRLPNILDRASKNTALFAPIFDDVFQIGLNWHDGTPVSWQSAGESRTSSMVTFYDTVQLDHDLHGVTSLTVTIQRTTGDHASVDINVPISVSYGEIEDYSESPPQPVPPPPASSEDFWRHVYWDQSPPAQSVDLPLTSLGRLRSGIEIPSNATAAVTWPDRTVSTARLKSLGTVATAGGDVWEYDVVVDRHRLDAGQSLVHLMLADGSGDPAHAADFTTYLYGVLPGMTPITNGDLSTEPDNVGTTSTEEGSTYSMSLISFIDHAGFVDSDYHASVRLDDGTVLPATVQTNALDERLTFNSVTADLTLWNPAGKPLNPDEYFKRVATLTVSRGDVTFTTPFSIYVRPSQTWLTPNDSSDNYSGIPPTLKLTDRDPYYVFPDRHGEVTLKVTTLSDIDPADLDVTLTWDERHQTSGRAIRTSPGHYIIHATHTYPHAGSYDFSATVRYGQTTQTISRPIVAADRSPQPASDGLLIVDNPVIDNAAAEIDWGKQDVSFGTVAFADANHPTASRDLYHAEIVFDDGSPTRTTIDDDFSDSDDPSPVMRLYMSAYFATAGTHPFTATIRTDDGRSITVRGTAEVLPKAAAEDGIYGGTAGVIIGWEGEPLKPADVPVDVPTSEAIDPQPVAPARYAPMSMPLPPVSAAIDRASSWSTLSSDRLWQNQPAALSPDDDERRRMLVNI